MMSPLQMTFLSNGDKYNATLNFVNLVGEHIKIVSSVSIVLS